MNPYNSIYLSLYIDTTAPHCPPAHPPTFFPAVRRCRRRRQDPKRLRLVLVEHRRNVEDAAQLLEAGQQLLLQLHALCACVHARTDGGRGWSGGGGVCK